MKNKTKKFNSFEVSFLVIITCAISLVVGYVLSERKQNKTNDKVLNEFINTYNEITDKYYEKIDKQELLSGAVSGMLSTLDQHSALIDQDENDNFSLMLDGSYSGIGIEIAAVNDKVIIIGVIENSPAAKAGIKAGDILVQIDDLDMAKQSTQDIANYIRKNTKKNEFTIAVERDEEKIEYKLKKDHVVITSVAGKIIKRDDYKIGYMYISIFSSTTASQFAKKLEKFEKENVDGIIIDIRENSGGYLTTAVSMLSMLLDQSKIMYQMDKNGKISKYYSTGNKNYKKQIVILQNNQSASAAEMLSASLKDNLNAIVVGEKSYGKGTVQEYNYLSNGDIYKYTTKKWLTPKGKCIDEVGIVPDVEVSLSEDYYTDPTENDNQLETAIQTMVDKLNENN